MNCAIIGIGNSLMGDDGAGLAVLERLAQRARPEGIALVDGGTAGVGLLHLLAGLDSAVLVDAIDFGGRPGEVRTFAPQEVRAVLPRARLSLHEGDVLQLIALAERLGQCPRPILLCAIQPERIAPGRALSPAVEDNLPALAREAWRQAAAMRRPEPPCAKTGRPGNAITHR